MALAHVRHGQGQSDWLGDQDAIEYLCRNAPEAVYELEHWGVPFSRTDDGKILQRAFGGMTMDFGKGPAKRTCAAADRTGHAMLHTMYGQALRHSAEFFIEYFAIDLIMDDEGRCRGVIALSMQDGTLHRFRAHQTILATGGYGRAYFSCTTAHICTGDGNAMVLRAGLPLQDMEFVQFHPTGVYGAGVLITEGARGEGGFLPIPKARNSWSATRHRPRTSPRAMWFRAPSPSRSGKAAGTAPRRITCICISSHLDADLLAERLPGITDLARIFAGRRTDARADPDHPHGHYNMGGIPTNLHGEVVYPKDGDPDAIVPGLFALGEAACASVHGANRLGSNSLIDLVVFGRAAAYRCAEADQARERHARTAQGRRRRGHRAARPVPLRRRRHADRRSFASRCRRPCRRDCAVFRTSRGVAAGRRQRSGRSGTRAGDISVKDRSLIWNTDLIETLEFDNLISQAAVTVAGRARAGGKPGRACARGFPQARRRQVDEAHSVFCGLWHPQCAAGLSARCTNYTLSNEIAYIEPKERVY